VAHVSHKLSNSLEGALAGGGDPATSPLYVFGPFLRLIVVAGVAQITFGASIWMVVLTVALVSLMYRLVMQWIVDGSGGSGLGEEEFGSWAVKLNASITFIEYTLTFLVSMAAMVTFLADRLPALNQHSILGIPLRAVLAIALSIGTGWLVNRGPKMAARVFGPATAGVLLLLWAMIISTILQLGFKLPRIDFKAFTSEYIGYTLGGFARILALMTGIEIFANLVAAYDGTPRQKSRMAFRSLLIIMGTTSIAMLIVGPAIYELSDPTNGEVSVFTQTMDQLLPTPLAFLGTLVGVLVLLSASAASAQGLQNLALGLRARHYIPAVVGQRNAFEVAAVPVWIEVAIVTFSFLVFGTNEETYLAIYAAGVFILLSMTAWAATKRLLRLAGDGATKGIIGTLVGTILAAILTTIATVIIFAERFADGAWIYFILIPLLYAVFTFYRSKLGVPVPTEEIRALPFSDEVTVPTVQFGENNGHLPAIDRVLVPLDGSELSEVALAVASTISRSNGTQLVLMSVRQGAVGHHLIPNIQAELSTEGESVDFEQYLGQVSAELQQSGITSESSITVGEAAEEISSRIQHGDIDLLVLTTHGRTGFGRVLMGSVADEVIQRATIPMLLIRPFGKQKSEILSFNKVLVALDGSEDAELSLPYAAAFGRRFDSGLLLLTVPDDLATSAHVNDLREYLERVSDTFDVLDLETETVVVGSDPGYTILEVAESEQVDMIMLATHGRGDRERFMIGSVADTVLNHSPCPVFLVPIRVKTELESDSS
jgi:nucleotide-binding universal stress UspA family protein/predicted membrane protein